MSEAKGNSDVLRHCSIQSASYAVEETFRISILPPISTWILPILSPLCLPMHSYNFETAHYMKKISSADDDNRGGTVCKTFQLHEPVALRNLLACHSVVVAVAGCQDVQTGLDTVVAAKDWVRRVAAARRTLRDAEAALPVPPLTLCASLAAAATSPAIQDTAQQSANQLQ